MRILALLVLVPAVALAAPKKAPKKAPKAKPAEQQPPKPDAPPPPDAASEGDAGKVAPPQVPAPQQPTPTGGGTTMSDPPKQEPPKQDGPDVDSLRQEYLSLRDELFKSRARANAVATQLYSTKIQVKLTYTTARYYNPAKASIRLDGASIYEDATGAIGGDDGVRFTGYIAPGRHVLTFRVEATGKDDDSFTSVTESQVVVKAVAGKDLVVAAKARDSGDIAYEWKRKESGSYGLGLDVSVKTTAREGEGKKK